MEDEIQARAASDPSRSGGFLESKPPVVLPKTAAAVRPTHAPLQLPVTGRLLAESYGNYESLASAIFTTVRVTPPESNMSQPHELTPGDSAISLTSPNPSSKSNFPSTLVGLSSPADYAPHSYADLTPEQQAAQDLENSTAIQQAQAQILIDSGSEYSASDAGYESDSVRTASTSITSNVRDYAFENGRRYHKFREGAYNFPNDDSEQEREDMKHAMMVNLCQTLHFAPIGPNPQNIMDMGTGTGIWSIEMGDMYPSASVIGVDLSPIQPSWVPPNVRFTVDDVESPWLRPKDHFDYIHARHTVMAIKDWPQLMRRSLEHLKPGGWLELQEIHHYPQCHDGSMPPNHPVAQYWNLIFEALAVLGINFNGTMVLADVMREAGFVNVETRIFHIPIGTWPSNKVLKMVGLYWRTILINGLQPIAMGPLTRGLKWTREQVDAWLEQVKDAYMDGWCHSHMPLYIICGQKPEEGKIYN